jgi:hypothetical protein
MKIKYGRFHDAWRGNGWFVALHRSGGWLCFGFRPFHWHTAQPSISVRRWYLGPFELERAV